MIAMIAGGSGLIGTHLVEALLAAKPSDAFYYDSIFLLTRQNNITSPDPIIKYMKVDFQNLSENLKSIPADHVYCTLGTTIKKAGSKSAFYQVDHDYPIDLFRVMHRNGADKFAIVSSIGADPKSISFYLRVKGEMEQQLQEIGLKTLHILRPSLLLGQRSEFRLGEEIGKSISGWFAPLMTGLLKNYRPISAEKVARFMIQQMHQNTHGLHIYESGQIL